MRRLGHGACSEKIVQYIRYRTHGLITFWLCGQTLPKQGYPARPAKSIQMSSIPARARLTLKLKHILC
jgi:hypothetical protein